MKEIQNFKSRDLQFELQKIFAAHVLQGDTLIVGVSGGPDSTALLLLLSECAQKIPCTILVAHVNHGIRGKDAQRDEKFVADLAKKLGHTFFVKRVKLAGKTGQEAKGRTVRREFFEKLVATHHARFILTAHTQDDQLETIMFNFLRGSGPKGLAGMQKISGIYFKPLLSTSKSALLHYLKEKKQKFRHDLMNDDARYSRVLVRKKILPLARTINPSLAVTLTRSAHLFAELEMWLCTEAEKFLSLHQRGRALFALKDFEKLPEPVKYAVIQCAFVRTLKTSYYLNFVNVDAVLNMLAKKTGNKKIVCGKKINFYLKKSTIYIEKV